MATWREVVKTWREYDNKTEDFVTLNEATRVVRISERRDSLGKVFVLKLAVGQVGNINHGVGTINHGGNRLRAGSSRSLESGENNSFAFSSIF